MNNRNYIDEEQIAIELVDDIQAHINKFTEIPISDEKIIWSKNLKEKNITLYSYDGDIEFKLQTYKRGKVYKLNEEEYALYDTLIKLRQNKVFYVTTEHLKNLLYDLNDISCEDIDEVIDSLSKVTLKMTIKGDIVEIYEQNLINFIFLSQTNQAGIKTDIVSLTNITVIPE